MAPILAKRDGKVNVAAAANAAVDTDMLWPPMTTLPFKRPKRMEVSFVSALATSAVATNAMLSAISPMMPIRQR